MKTIVRITLFTLAVAAFTSCVKSVDIVVTPPASNSLTGSWVLSSAAVESGNHWTAFDPGINGILYFSANGGAEYDDANTSMTGSWAENTVSSGYYDQYGNYYTDTHNALQVDVADNAGGSLDLYFDGISFAGSNEFIATYFDGKTVERYVFDRY